MADKKREERSLAIRANDARLDAPGNTVRAPRRKRKAPGGSKIGITVLRAQAIISFQQGKDYAEGLARGGFTPAKNLEIKAALDAFDEAYLRFTQARMARKQATLDFHAFVDECVAVRNRLHGALRIATQDKPNPFKQSDLALSMTHRPGPLSRWLLLVQVALEANRSTLPKVAGEDLLTLARTFASKLIVAIGAQAASRKRIASISVEQKAARKKLLDAIDVQRLSAAVAFPRNKRMLRQFVPLWLKRRAKRSAQPTQEALAPTPAELPPPALPPKAG